MKKYILLLFLGLTCTLYAQEIKLNVAPTPQDKDNWCVAAATKCVLGFYGINKIQCDIMDYIRAVSSGYGGYGCCVEMPSGFSHPCDKGVPLGYHHEVGSAKGILINFGNLASAVFELPETISEIRDNLTLQRPQIIHLNYYSGEFKEHAVVICGIRKKDNVDEIYIMDPLYDFLYWDSYNNLLDNGGRRWYGTLALTSCSRDYPCHCFNCIKDEDEDDIDCGGASCEPCYTPPPPPPGSCTNCQKDPNEEEMDCGGPDCPPCEDVPKERTITSTAQLRPDIAAYKKITAKDATTVASGKKVSFITKEEGSIILLPGFTAENGCTFITRRQQDLSEYGRICGTICGKWWIPSSCYSFGDNRGLYMYDLQYANKIEYEIYDLNGYNLKYSNVKDISNNGTIFLWYPPFYLENVTYRIFYDTYHCDNSKRRGSQDFTVIGWDNRGKSSNDKPDETEYLNIPQFLSPENLKIQDEMNAPAFSIIPNPNTGTFQLETNFPLSDIAHLKITDMLGGIVYETKNLTTNTIQIQNATNGLYFVMVILKDGNLLTQKMMKQR